jgi:hypothetical protein
MASSGDPDRLLAMLACMSGHQPHGRRYVQNVAGVARCLFTRAMDVTVVLGLAAACGEVLLILMYPSMPNCCKRLPAAFRRSHGVQLLGAWILVDLRKRRGTPHKTQHFFVRRSKLSGKPRRERGSRRGSGQLEARDQWSDDSLQQGMVPANFASRPLSDRPNDARRGALVAMRSPGGSTSSQWSRLSLLVRSRPTRMGRL